jgi:hypothetical protein
MVVVLWICTYYALNCKRNTVWYGDTLVLLSIFRNYAEIEWMKSVS